MGHFDLLHTKTLTRAFAERHNVLARSRRIGVEPTLWVECPGFGEEVWVLVH